MGFTEEASHIDMELRSTAGWLVYHLRATVGEVQHQPPDTFRMFIILKSVF
jgi:hypothetical protein